MKKILGSLSILFAITALWAKAPYYFEADLSKSALYVGETAVVEVRFYKKRQINTVIGKSLREANGAYTLEEFEIEREDEGAYGLERFIYLLRFQKPGEYELPLYGEIQKFNEEDIVESNNHRDAMQVVASSKERVFIRKFHIRVTQTPENIPVGSFTMTLLPDETAVLANEPAHFSIRIEGAGDIRDIGFPGLTLEGVNVFVQEGERTRWLENGELKGRKVNHYAAVSERGFTIPSFSARFFDPVSKAVSTAKSDPVSVSVQEDAAFTRGALLDEPEQKKAWYEGFSLENVLESGGYLLIFAAGYLSARITLPRLRRKKESRLAKAVRKATSPRELLQLLLPYADQQDFHLFIAQLEDENVGKKRFSDLKKEILFYAKKWL